MRVCLLSVLAILIAGSTAFGQEFKFVKAWGKKGDKPGEFFSPVCIAINAKDEVFVADLNNSRIQKFDVEGNYQGGFDLPFDTPPRKSCMIGGMAVDQRGHLYLSYMIQHKIGMYTEVGKLVREWGKKGTADSEFDQPGGIIIQRDGTLVIADQCNHRIQHFTPVGKFVKRWGSFGSEAGQFGAPGSKGSRFGGPHFLAQDSQGRLYSTEGVRGRIQQFASDGKPLSAWGDKTKEPGAFGEYQFGKLKDTFGPIGVFVDRQDRVWVSSLNDRVQCFTTAGHFLFSLTDPDEFGTFSHPHGMATDSRGFLYIADSGNQQIQKYLITKEK